MSVDEDEFTTDPAVGQDELPTGASEGVRDATNMWKVEDGIAAAFDDAVAGVSADDGEIARLAALDPLAYDRERQAAAERLGVRASTLDFQVKKRRDKLGLGLDQGGPGIGKALELPEHEPWRQHVDAAECLDELRATILRYVVMSFENSVVVTLWIIFTHLIDQFDFAPRLLIKSPMPRCGKTTLLDIIGELVQRMLGSANITAAAVFRTIEAAQPTLLIDEADTFMEKSDELRGVINSGHRRSNAQVIRVVEINGEHEPRIFSTWCAMAIAGIGAQHLTIVDRSFVIELQRKLFGEPVARLDRKARERLNVLARKVARLARDMVGQLNEDPPAVPAELNDRAADNWRVVLAIADAAGGHWPATARAAARAAAGRPEPETAAMLLLRDLRELFEDRNCPSWMMTGEILKELHEGAERPWSTWSKGKAMTDEALAKLLRGFGVESCRPGGRGNRARGYALADLDPVFERYLGQRSREDADANQWSPPPRGGLQPGYAGTSWKSNGFLVEQHGYGADGRTQVAPRNKPGVSTTYPRTQAQEQGDADASVPGSSDRWGITL